MRAMAHLAGGHAAAMITILLPFTILVFLVEWQREIQVLAGAIVVGLGVYLLLSKNRATMLACVPPHRLGVWSFLVVLGRSWSRWPMGRA